MTATGTFIFICSACGYKARLPEQFAGRTIKCPGCQAPQVATAPSNVQRKTAVITRVAATPVPFTLPKDQEDALAGIPSATPVEMPASAAPTASRPFPSPLPGAIQITTDRVARMKTPAPGEAAPPVAKLATGGTVDFTCASCNARLRLPGHYAGKSILCPKCSAPQKVAIAPEPMDTTRSLAQKADEPAPSPVTPAAQTSQPIPGSGTGIRAVSVTPLPQPYPTPLPTQAPAPTPAVEPAAAGSAGIEAAAPATAAPDIQATPADAPIDDEVAITPSKSFAKPHPSKGASKPRVPTSTHVRTAEPAAAAAKSPIGLIATAGILVLIAIGLAAGLVYHLLALGQTRERLATAELDAKTAATREHEASLKLKELEERLAETELKLKAAEEAKAAAEAAAKTAEKPAEAPPADAKPVDGEQAAEAPKPVEEAAPATQP